MSLSKYFKNSEGFQPEKIVKTSVKSKTGWEASKEQPLSSQFIATEQVKNIVADNVNDKTDNNPATPQAEEPDPSPPQQKTASPSPESTAQPADLTDYISITEVQKKLEEAYDTGMQKGLEKAAKDYGSATNALTTICQQLDTIRETIITNSSREMQEFALSIAERIIRSSLKKDNNTVIATIDEALQRAVKSDEFYIYIHPDDYDIVMEKSTELIAGISGLNNIVIKKDITIEKGGTKIESENCTIDATIASQFEIIEEEVKKRL